MRGAELWLEALGKEACSQGSAVDVPAMWDLTSAQGGLLSKGCHGRALCSVPAWGSSHTGLLEPFPDCPALDHLAQEAPQGFRWEEENSSDLHPPSSPRQSIESP